MASDFDVFLSYHSPDRAAVERLAGQLEERGLKVWLDVWCLRPGLPWRRELEAQIERLGAAAVIVGASGIGPWQDEEIDALLQTFVDRRCPVIPVILADAGETPSLPPILKNRTWVDFRQSDSDPLDLLIWGITGEAPTRPTPSYPDDETRELSEALKAAYLRRAELSGAGEDATAVIEEISRLRWRLRQGAQLKAGDSLLSGRFQLREVIGHGGFAQVWKAYDERSRALVAIKVLHGQHTDDRSRRERWSTVAEFCGALRKTLAPPLVSPPSPGQTEFLHERDGSVLVRVPAGEFMLGTDEDLKGLSEEWQQSPKPEHQACLGTYWIGKFPVTNSQYGRFLEEDPDYPKPEFWEDERFNEPQQPVVGVSWRDAKTYCEWAGLELPSEAQWEAAARGTDGRAYPWGRKRPTAVHADFGKSTKRTSRMPSVATRRALDPSARRTRQAASGSGAPTFGTRMRIGIAMVRPIRSQKATLPIAWCGADPGSARPGICTRPSGAGSRPTVGLSALVSGCWYGFAPSLPDPRVHGPVELRCPGARGYLPPVPNPGSPSRLRAFLAALKSSMPSGPFLSEYAGSCVRSCSYVMRGTPKPQESEMRRQSTRMTERMPG